MSKKLLSVKSVGYVVSLMFISVLLTSCDVTEFLDAKPDKSYVIPKTIEDFQAMMDADGTMNSDYPGSNIIASDNHYNTYDQWITYPDYVRNDYIWTQNSYPGSFLTQSNWEELYVKVSYANIVLAGLNDIKPTEKTQAAWNNVRGSALFFRAFSFYQLAQMWAKPYDEATASSDLGIPLRLSADRAKKVTRPSVQATYDRIIQDLIEAEQLLPESPLYKTRPSKPSARALLARVYQTMENYEKALEYASSSLELYDVLMDYNLITETESFYSFEKLNPEVLFHCETNVTLSLYFVGGYGFVDSTLYSLYRPDDLRTELFFTDAGDGRYTFSGSYSAVAYLFCGIATDEVYLIKAESEARLGDKDAAMQTLNTLLETRWKTGTFVPFTAGNADEALEIILRERRKSLLFRGLRWTDLRRLNQEPEFAVTLTRKFENGDTYTLPPNDPRYIFPIPQKEINLTGIEQNQL